MRNVWQQIFTEPLAFIRKFIKILKKSDYAAASRRTRTRLAQEYERLNQFLVIDNNNNNNHNNNNIRFV
jgi:hypothetical protein